MKQERNTIDYKDLYDQLGTKLMGVIDRMERMDKGLQKTKTESLTRNGGSSGKAAKTELRIHIAKEECKAITDAIRVIKPMADYETKIKEVEAKNRELEKLLKDMGDE